MRSRFAAVSASPARPAQRCGRAHRTPRAQTGGVTRSRNWVCGRTWLAWGRASAADPTASQTCPSRCVTSRSDSRTSARSSTTRTLSESGKSCPSPEEAASRTSLAGMLKVNVVPCPSRSDAFRVCSSRLPPNCCSTSRTTKSPIPVPSLLDANGTAALFRRLAAGGGRPGPLSCTTIRSVPSTDDASAASVLRRLSATTSLPVAIAGLTKGPGLAAAQSRHARW